MGVFHIKVIETRKVAIRTSFFVNYPFVRIMLNGKEQSKHTNFRPGVEWWDKILSFTMSPGSVTGSHFIIQARDKSIHVFGSDWLGEISINASDFADGAVHQKWFKLGKGFKKHGRPPRGYIHLSFHYIDDADKTTRPFASSSVEPVLTFEEFLAKHEGWSVDYNATKLFSTEGNSKKTKHRVSFQEGQPDSPSARSSTSSDEESIQPSPIVEKKSSFRNTSQRAIVQDSKPIPKANPVGDLIDLSFEDVPQRQTFLTQSQPMSSINRTGNQTLFHSQRDLLSESTSSVEDNFTPRHTSMFVGSSASIQSKPAVNPFLDELPSDLYEKTAALQFQQSNNFNAAPVPHVSS